MNSKETFNLSGKSIFVTGGLGGIGKAIVDRLISAGADVIISGRNSEALNDFCAKYDGAVKAIELDLAKDFDADDVIESVAQLSEKKLSGVICNAGVTRDGLAMRMRDEDWSAVMHVNLTATFKLNRAAIKYMMRQRIAGRIINISSVIGVIGNAGQANYAASKAGIIGMSKSLAREVATRQITVNCIAPGFIRTPMTDVMTEEQQEVIMKNIPMQSFGEPEDIAIAALYLVSDEARYITGQTLHVNGGMYM